MNKVFRKISLNQLYWKAKISAFTNDSVGSSCRISL